MKNKIYQSIIPVTYKRLKRKKEIALNNSSTSRKKTINIG